MSKLKQEAPDGPKPALDREKLLVSFLGGLNEEMAEKLAAVLEQDRLSGGTAMPVDAILKGLRPKLRGRDPGARKRVPTPQRLFVEVFEGLVVDEVGPQKRPGRIARTTIPPLWNWLVEHDISVVEPMLAKIRAAIFAGTADQDAAVGELDQYALKVFSDALAEIADDPKATRRLSDALGGARAIDDLREITRILAIAPLIRALRARLPREIDELEEAEYELVRDAFDKAIAMSPPAADYLLLALGGRFVRPWDLFGLAGRLLGANDDQDLHDSELALVGERLVTDLEVEAVVLKGFRPSEFDPDEASARLKKFAALQSGMTRQLGMRKDGAWGKRLLKGRGTVSSALEGLFDRVWKDIQAVMPLTKAPPSSKVTGRVPVMDSLPAPGDVDRAASLAAFVGMARNYASQLGYSVAHDRIRTEAASYLTEYGDGLVATILHGRRSELDKARTLAEAALRIMAPLVAEDALAIASRRIKSALAEQSKRG